MAAERADRRDELLHLAYLINGKVPDQSPHREELDDWLTEES